MDICGNSLGRERKEEERKILALRILLVSVLVTAAVTTTVISYQQLHSAEHALFTSRFNSASENALKVVVESFDRMNVGVQQLAATLGHTFPDAKMWPNVTWVGLQPAGQRLAHISSLDTIGFAPIVYPDQVESYESFIANWYLSGADPYVNATEFLFPLFKPGTIWREDYSVIPSNYYPDRYGNTTNSTYQILTPLSQYTLGHLAGPYQVGYNVHSDADYTAAMDSVLDCAYPNDLMGKQTVKPIRPSTTCGTISPAIPLPYPTEKDPNPQVEDMVGTVMQPIYPFNDESMVVGFVAGGMSWKSLLRGVVPASDKEFHCVVESDSGAFTFHIEHGKPEFLGMGDLHDSHYSDMKRSSALLSKEIHLTRSSTYTLSFYPCKEFEDQFHTDLPLTGALILLFIFLFCSGLFALYDLLMRRRFGRNQAVLDTKRRFVRFISHEIRTPLNTVRLGMKLLEVEMGKFAVTVKASSSNDLLHLVETALSAWKHLTDEIVESSESAVEVLNDLLNYDKIEVGTLKLEFSFFDIRAVVKKVTAAMQVQAQQKDITIQLHQAPAAGASAGNGAGVGAVAAPHALNLGPGEGVVVGDALRVGQVLRNLISNALKFTPTAGTVAIAVDVSTKTHQVPEKAKAASPLFHHMVHCGTVSIAVKDSGAGLTPKQLEEICAEGVQFNASELQAGQGSGLGLFISKGIVEQHGGRLVVTSEGLGKGVTFTVELPLFKQEAGTHAAQTDSAKAVGVKPAHLEPRATTLSTFSDDALQPAPTPPQPPRRMLVVDDSAFSRKMLVRLLASKGHTCEQAEDGADALKKYSEMVARNEAPDAILMDFEMPVMNGPTATAKLREMGCTCLIVGVTGNVLAQDVSFFIEHGADSVLPKPLVLEDFEQLLRERSDAEMVKRMEEEVAQLRVTMKADTSGKAGSGNKGQVHPADENV